MVIAVLSNNSAWTYNLRGEILEAFIKNNHKVYVVVPRGEKAELLEQIGCEIIESPLERHGTNPIKDLKLFLGYFKKLKRIKPDIVFTYTIKPNVYGGMASTLLKIPYVANITGLGTAVKNEGILQKFTLMLYKLALSGAKHIFFQNRENIDFFIRKKIISKNYTLLPGSGVNINKFSAMEYPSEESIEFVFIARIMRDKGIDHYLDTAKYIKQKYSNTVFHICGYCEEGYEETLKKLTEDGTVIYHGNVDDVREIFKKVHCIINPSYHEGMSNVLLEASASARPCLCSDIAGCREIVEDKKTGFVFEVKNTDSLIEAIEKFLSLTYEEKRNMGIKAREYVEKKFDRNIVINEYMNKLKN